MQLLVATLLAGALFIPPFPEEKLKEQPGSTIDRRPPIGEPGLGDELGRRSPIAPDGRLRWDAHEKALMWGYLSLSAVDAYQTGRMPAGYREGNPFLRSLGGDRPNVARAAAVKSVFAYALLRMTDRYTRTPRQRKTILYILNAIQLFVVVRNEQTTGGIVFR